MLSVVAATDTGNTGLRRTVIMESGYFRSLVGAYSKYRPDYSRVGEMLAGSKTSLVSYKTRSWTAQRSM
jgi:hypothetical protein